MDVLKPNHKWGYINADQNTKNVWLLLHIIGNIIMERNTFIWGFQCRTSFYFFYIYCDLICFSLAYILTSF